MFIVSPRAANALVLAAGFALSLLSGSVLARTVNLAWDPPSSANPAGYKIHYGQNSGQYTASIDVGKQTSFPVTGLQDGVAYYFAVTAYDAARSSQSGYSNEVSVGASGSLAPAAILAPGAASLTCDGVPSLDSIATPQSVHVGQVLKVFATAVDCDGDKISIRVTGKPRHATFAQGYNAGFQKHLGKLKFKPMRSQANKSFDVVFTAREVRGKRKFRQVSVPKVVTITVLPALTAVPQAVAATSTAAPIARISIASAQYQPKQQAIVVLGHLFARKGASKDERKKAFEGRELTLIDSASNGVIGMAMADGSGNFKLISTVNEKSQAACFIEVETAGLRAKPTAVKGLSHCK